MSNGTVVNVYERLFKLWSAICKMIVDGTRDASKVAEVLQSIVDGVTGGKIYLRRLFEMSDAIVYEQIADGKYAELFGSLGEKRRRWKDRPQVEAWCRKNPDKLRGEGYRNFFELEGDLVAHVRVDDDGQLSVRVRPLDYAYVWRAESRRRIVVPQLAA